MRDVSKYLLFVLAFMIVGGFFGVLAYLMANGVPQEGNEVILMVVGALVSLTSLVGNYYFGSSTGSKAKDQVIADLKGSKE